MSETVVAQFTAEGPGAPTEPLDVHFNPASLRLSVTNTIQDEQQPGSQSLQSVRKSATKLDVELLFDTTETGEDVRTATGVLKSMGRPGGTQKSVLPQVTFTWGVFAFKGVIESLQETIDFFSSSGVPLRSTVQVVMQSLQLDQILEGGDDEDSDTLAIASPSPTGRGATDTATRAGNPAAGRALAAANGLASMRFTAAAGLAVGASVQISGPVGFTASAGAGLGISGGAGIGISGGAGIGISGGAGIGLSGGAGLGVSGGAGFGISGGAGFSASSGFSAAASFGAGASAGVSATNGAFAGLGVSKSAGTSFTLDVDRLRPPVATFTVSADPTAAFDATGRVVASASAGLRADVRGPQGSVKAWIG